MSEVKTLVPKLRFLEFRGKGGWEEMTIGDIGSFYYGKSAPKWSLEENAPTPCVRYGELYTRFGAIITETYSRTNIDPKKLRFSKGGEILVPRVGEKPEEFGKCCSYLPLGNVAIGEMISVFETTQNPLFYTYYFRNLWAQFSKVVEGQNVKNLYYAVLEPLRICRPTPPEQQEIANCLSSLDELITEHSQKHATLKAHKKGLMQQLFPCEGKTTPKLRFPAFRDSGEWASEKLGEITGFLSGGTPSKKIPEYWGGDIPWISAASMHSIRIGFSENNITELAREEGARIISKGTLLLLVRGSMLHKRIPIGITVLDVAFNQDVKALILKKDILEMFLLHLLISCEGRLLSVVTKTGIGAGKLDTDDLKDFLIHFPIDKAEQQRIANCLSSLDELITSQFKKIELLKTHKKGLMQQLFPTTDEVQA